MVAENDLASSDIKTRVDKYLPHADPEKKKLIEEALYNMHVKNQSPAQAMGFTPQQIEIIYREAYNKFQGGKYDEAIELFTMLREMFPEEFRYSFAIGAALQYQKKYHEAAGYYLYCSQLDPLNPVPKFHLYDCFMKTNQPEAALYSILETVYLAKLDPRYQTLKEKAILEEKFCKEHLAKELDEREQAKKVSKTDEKGESQ